MSITSPLSDPIVFEPTRLDDGESPVILPLPPRREDEPDSDPLALPDESFMSTSVITRVVPVRKTPTTKMPTVTLKSASVSQRQTNHGNKRTSETTSPAVTNPQSNTVPIRPLKMKSMGSSENRTSLGQPAKPKISVKSPAELSGPRPHPSQFIPRQIGSAASKPVDGSSRIMSKPKKQRMSTSAQGQPALMPTQPPMQFIMAPQPQQSHIILTPTSTPSQFIMTQTHPPGNALTQPIIIPDQNLILTPINTRPSALQPQNNMMVITNPRTLPSNSAFLRKSEPAQSKKVAQVQTKVTSVAKAKEKKSSPDKVKRKVEVEDTDSIEYTERLARQAIAAVRADIVKTQQKSRVVQKKVDLLKLKVSTYESFISKLVNRRIISKESAKQGRVLDRDLARHNRRRKDTSAKANVRPKNSSNGKNENLVNSKENSNDTTESLDSLTAIDHDYL